MNISQQVMNAIENSGTTGMTSSEIRNLAWGISHCGNSCPKDKRGHWSSNITGWRNSVHGLIKTGLTFWCIKNSKGRWVRDFTKDHGGKFYQKIHYGNICLGKACSYRHLSSFLSEM
jgi:hypothetical protein